MESKTIRYRVNIERSVKGVHTYSATCEGEGFTQEHILAESDRLVRQLELRYPPVEEKGK